ncbi:MAG: hypothetical protein ACX94C_11100 [Phycisphaerales bacterium]
MGKENNAKRKELLPDIDPSWVEQAISRPEEEEDLEPDFDPDDPDAVWVLGNDPEAKISSVADRRSVVRRQMLSAGGQFVMGIVMLFIGLGLIIMAITNPVLQYIIPAAIFAPISFWYMRIRWRRWLGSAPYFYRLLTSLGEDAENILVDHEQKKRQKYVNQVGDLYAVNKAPKKRKKKRRR